MTILSSFEVDVPAIRGFSFDSDALIGLSHMDRQLFERFGSGPVETLPFNLIHQAFEHHAARQPDASAVEHLGQTISYGKLDADANRLAGLLTHHGVMPGHNVGLFLTRSIPMVVGILATLKIGASYVPQHVGVSPPSQLENIVGQINASVVLTLGDLKSEIPNVDGVDVIAIDEFLATDAEPPSTIQRPRPLVRPDNNCFVLFTSGTTGQPNGVQVTHRNICNVLLTDPGRLGMAPGKRVAQLLSIMFDMAAWEILGSMMNGATLVIRGDDLTAAAARVDIVIATPSILGSIETVGCSNVETVAVAGEPCPVPLAERWGRFARFYNSCGPTETTIINTAHCFEPRSGQLTIGRPTPNNTVYILDEQMKPCPIGVVGEMWAGGDCVTAGYLNNADLTEQRYRPDPYLGGGRMMFRTRDLGKWTDDGELEHFGRTDDQVKIRGFRVELDSVSAALESTTGCTAAVTLKLDSRTLVAYLQPETVDVDEAIKSVSQALPYYCTPTWVVALKELPRTQRGKVDKRFLLDIAATDAANEASTSSDAR